MSLAAYLGIASGGALILTAVGLALARPRRVGGWFFVGFLVAWGAEVALFNSLGFFMDSPAFLSIQRIAYALVLVEILFLVHFAVRFTRQLDTAHRWWSTATAAFVLVVGLVFAVDPSLFAGGADDVLTSTALIFVPNFAALFVIVGILVDRHRETRSEIEHREVRLVLGGLLLYTAYTAGFYLSLYTFSWVLEGVPLSQQILSVLFVLGTAFLVLLAVRTWRLESVPEHWSSWEKPALLATIVGPLALGLLTGTAEIVDLPRVDLFGLLRIGAALLVAYGLLKFEIFDIDRKVKTGIRGSVVAATFVLMFFAVSETVEVLVSDAAGNWAGLGAAGMLTVVLKPLEERAQRIADRAMPGVNDSEDYEEKRSVEVYQAAVERAARDEVLTDREKEILSGLRDELGLRDNEAREIEEEMLPEPVVA